MKRTFSALTAYATGKRSRQTTDYSKSPRLGEPDVSLKDYIKNEKDRLDSHRFLAFPYVQKPAPQSSRNDGRTRRQSGTYRGEAYNSNWRHTGNLVKERPAPKMCDIPYFRTTCE